MNSNRRCRRPRGCPSCGATTVVRIVYGMPGPDMVEAAGRGDVVLGGCSIDDSNPDWHCITCDLEWS